MPTNPSPASEGVKRACRCPHCGEWHASSVPADILAAERERERERCAKIADAHASAEMGEHNSTAEERMWMAMDIAAAIRAGGQP